MILQGKKEAIKISLKNSVKNEKRKAIEVKERRKRLRKRNKRWKIKRKEQVEEIIK